MTPLINAVTAVAYIVVVVLCLRFMDSARHDTPDTLLDGLGFISLLVCSVAVMAFLFFYQPLVRLAENKKSEALSYFLQTMVIFGAITLATLIVARLQ